MWWEGVWFRSWECLGSGPSGVMCSLCGPGQVTSPDYEMGVISPPAYGCFKLSLTSGNRESTVTIRAVCPSLSPVIGGQELSSFPGISLGACIRALGSWVVECGKDGGQNDRKTHLCRMLSSCLSHYCVPNLRLGPE